jgi:hypothetical protein
MKSVLTVLFQVGLDGIRMLDPSTSRTLRIYPLDTLTKWEVCLGSTSAEDYTHHISEVI